jgi:tetratricopeptide (TPR) repeat protein
MGPMRRAPAAALLVALLAAPVALPPAAARAAETAAPESAAEARAAERRVRRSLEDARALVREGRLEHAEAALRRGLETEPGHARLHRTLAEVLEAQGRFPEAAQERAAAEALAPAIAPLPEAPLDVAAAGLLVVLLPVDADAGPPEALAGRGGEPGALRTLEARLGVRLRGARVLHADFESVAAARAWLAPRAPRALLTLRVERTFCGDSIKDGRFAIGVVRAAAAAAGATDAAISLGREVRLDPGPGCESEALAHALERALAAPELRAALAAKSGAPAAFGAPAIRALFPGLGRRIDAALRTGEALLGAGDVAGAAEAFRRAAAVDSEDPVVRAYLQEAEATLALARELASRSGERPGEGEVLLDPRLSEEQHARAEAQLREEQRHRDELLAALAVLDEDLRAPPANLLAALHAAEIADARAFGPSLARRRSGGEIEARAAYAPDGSLLATYYFPAAGDHPVLREDDTDGDQRPDRWIAYEDDTRREIYESGASGRPTLRLVFAAGGASLERVEIDDDANGRPERILHYRAGAVSGESRDTNADGRLDVFDRLDAEGRVALREEDVDGDGEIDVRSHYERGKLVRRELARPELARPKLEPAREGGVTPE